MSAWLRQLGNWAGPAGVVLLVAAAALSVARPDWERVRAALAVVGGLALLVALYASFKDVRAFFARRTARYGLNVLAMVLLLFGIVALVEAISYRHSYRLDLTENRRHSLSPYTIEVLRKLKVPVEVTGFFRSDQPGKRIAEDLFKQYASYSKGKLTWQVVDPDRNPGLARRYGIESYGTVVLDTKTKSEKVLDAEEEKLTNSLVKVTREGKRIVYVVQGHGEAELSNTERPGFSGAKAAMEQANYEVKELLLVREAKVADDAALVLVAGPKNDLLPAELEALDAYIARGGKVLFMANPFQADGLKKYLEKYGIALGDDLVIDRISRAFGGDFVVPAIFQYEPHAITKEFGNVLTFFPLTRSVDVQAKPPKGVSAQVLAKSGPGSWGERTRAELDSGAVKQDPDDRPGPVPVAAVATVEATKPPEGKTNVKARIVVFGTANLAANQFLNIQGNKDLFLNTVSWLAEEEDLIAIRPKNIRQTPIVPTATEGRLVFWIPVVVLPLVVMACGISVLVRRRYTH
ncbi:MAG: GldG family protein [Candidatus Rokubacteria bacterium]|nr:GldG family protein [Candidatus Rokubacteria bacterium]